MTVKIQPAMHTLITLVVFVMCLAGCDVSEPGKSTAVEPLHLSGPTMGTWYNVKVISATTIDSKALSEEIKLLLSNINSLMSTYDDTSELSRFNREPINSPFALSPNTAEVLRMAINVSEKTEGAFDVTIGPVVNLWGFGPKGRIERRPSDVELKSVKATVGYKALVWHGQNVLSKTKPVYVDLSAIAKGYAVDQVANLLESRGYTRYLVDIGGELRAGNPKPTGIKWKVAVEQPVVHQRAIQKVFSLSNIGVATSGDYRNFYEFDGQRYSHTIDPRSGMPVKHSLASVSVIHDSVAYADAMATSLMVLGVEEGFSLAESEELNAYFIYRAQGGYKVKTTDGFMSYIQD